MHTLLIILAIVGGFWLTGSTVIFLWTSRGDWRHWRQNVLLSLTWPILLVMAACGGIHVI